MTAARTVIVVGGGLGGMSAAIHLRLAGFDVAVYEANAQVGGRASQIARGGYTFDVGPSLLNYPWVFEDLFRSAGRDLADYVTLLPVDPSVTFRWPDGERLALTSSLGDLLREFERLDPGSTPRALDFLRTAERRYTLAFDHLVTRSEDSYIRWLSAVGIVNLFQLGLGRSLHAELARYFRSARVREALGSYAMYLGGSPFQLPAFFSILPYGELAYGLWLPKGGVYGLVTAIERLAREIGVVIHTGRRVTRIVTQGGRASGIELEGFGPVSSDLVVSNVDVPTTDLRLLEDARLKRRAERTGMTPGVMTFYWGVRRRFPEMSHHTIYLPRDYRATFTDLFTRRRLPTELPFYVSVPSATDHALAPAGCSSVFVLVPMPLLSDMPEADWTSVTATVRKAVLTRLRGEGVALDDRGFAVEEVYTPRDWRDRFGLHDGSAFGAAHNLLQLGPRRAANTSREVPGLFYVGASTTPGTGMPMVVLGGKMVAQRVAAAR